MNTWVLNTLIVAAGLCFSLLVGIFVGYWMGRNSAERPFVSEAAAKVFDPGPGSEPDMDIFREAMAGPDDKRVPTKAGQ